MRSWRRSLVSRLAVAFLLPSFGIVGLIVVLVYGQARTTQREADFELLEGIAAVKEEALNAWIGHHYQDVVLLTVVPRIGELARGADSPGDAHRELTRLFVLIRGQKPGIAEIQLLSPRGGRVLISTETRHEGDIRAYDNYYIRGKSAPYIQNVYPSTATLRPTLTISAPVRTNPSDPSSALAAVLAVHLSLDVLDRNILQREGLGETGAVTLVDRHKVVLTGRHYGASTAPGAAPSFAVEEVAEGRSGSGLYTNYEGVAVVGVYRWLRERELGLIVEVPQEEAFRGARRLAGAILLMGAGSQVILALTVYFLAGRMARPILAITRAAERVREGDLEARAPRLRHDETGRLADTFNHMVEELGRFYGQMSEKIDQLERSENARGTLIAELESRNAELERFTYTVSHDLKGPLLTIKGMLGLLGRDLENGDAERIRVDVGHISGAADQMRRLLDELLELSRIGRVVGTFENCDLAEMARAATRVAMDDDSGPEAEIVVAHDLPTIFADRLRIREVFENLVSNALKFMGDQPAPRVEIGTRRDADETIVFVRDNGVGVPPAYREKIFGLFERLDPEVEGTGIGLAIVRRIVEFHGGRIWVESQGEGRGSTFCFTLAAEPPAA